MNTQISTITLSQVIPEATRAIERYTKRSDTNSILQRYDTHLSTEDLVMETAEKVIRANPEYLTKTYVWLAAKSVCINKCQKKRIHTVDVRNPFEGEEDNAPILEHSIEGDAYDHIGSLYDSLISCLSTEELEVLEALLDGTMYVEIAENLGISLRTLERRVQELKWKAEFLLTEQNPDQFPLVY